jgi:disulfide bond formation protein DsbB
VRCDEPAWTLFGLSMAGYNFFAALGLAALAALGAARARDGER